MTLPADVVMDSGERLPAGTEVLLVPQTTAASVLAENGKTLADILPAVTTSVVASSEQVIRLTDRLTRTEITVAALQSWARQNGYTGEESCPNP